MKKRQKVCSHARALDCEGKEVSASPWGVGAVGISGDSVIHWGTPNDEFAENQYLKETRAVGALKGSSGTTVTCLQERRNGLRLFAGIKLA